MPSVADLLKTTVSPNTFNTFNALIGSIGLTYLLEDRQHLVTLFAPNDLVFDRLGQGTLFALEHDLSRLEMILKNHVVPLRLTVADMQAYASGAPGDHTLGRDMAADAIENASLEVQTVAGNLLKVTFDGGLTIGGAQVLQPDLNADNGVIHIIDSILWPPDMGPETFGLHPLDTTGER